MYSWVKQWAIDRFGEVKEAKGGEEVRVNCPNPNCLGKKGVRDTKFHLYINIKSGVFICPRCGWKGHLREFVEWVDGTTWNEFVKYLRYNEFTDLGFDEFKKKIFEKLTNKSTQTSNKKVKLYKELPFKTLKITKETIAFRYLKRRGFSMEDVEKFSLRYCIEGKYAFRIIVPFYENRKLVYYIARKYVEDIPGVKVKNPSSSDNRMLPKNEVLFNIDNIDVTKPVVITEGVFDAMTVPNGIALLGKYMSKQQILKLKRKNVSKATVCLDRDAWTDTVSLAKTLKTYGFDVYVVRLTEYKDPNEAGKLYMRRLLLKAEKLDFSLMVKTQLNQ
ncbi:MAG: hypothetical protein DRI61_10965 [Chloroflexi bacterium]|nr:MAG: hypothetical protein DRI61_10965 [Chloroflexota bacterium]